MSAAEDDDVESEGEGSHPEVSWCLENDFFLDFVLMNDTHNFFFYFCTTADKMRLLGVPLILFTV